MSYDLFWNGPPEAARAYKESNDLKIKAENERLWLQGLYNFNAISVALSNIHLDGKQHKMNEYMKKPFDLFVKTEEEQKEEAEKVKQNVIASLDRFAKAFDAKKKG